MTHIRKTLAGMFYIMCLFLCSSCIPSERFGSCHVKTFLWENQNYLASYSSSGKLIELEADTSKIVFYYDEFDKLTASEIYFAGIPDARHKYEFMQGPYGITQVDHFNMGEHTRELIHYASPTLIDYTISQEFYHDTISFEIRHDFTFTSSNLKFVDSRSFYINTSYAVKQYDSKPNPFRALSIAVGNKLFFPVGLFAFFPVGQYDISYAARFSKNNPVYAQYQIAAAGLDPEIQVFTYDYVGGLVKKILWTDSSYGIVTSKNYEFTYSCP